MASFLTDLGKPYVEKLINGAIAESSYICCFTCIAEEFEQKKVKLKAERTTVGQRVEVARRRDKDIEANARLWEKQADELIQEDTKTKQTCFFGFCPNCMWQYKRGKELANKKEEIKQLIEKGEKLENIELTRRLPDVERYSSQDYISFKSRESKYTELLDALKDESNYITGLHGMGGTGKTTLAKKVGKELKQSEQFTHVIDTTVSYTPDIKKIQDAIAGPLGLKWEDCNESDRPGKLWSRLTNGEKILVILDDVWDRDRDPNLPLDFDAIGIPKRENPKGCRVLITTRSKRVLNKMDCHKIIELKLLSGEDAWIMFKSYAGISNSSPKSLIEKARKIANECKRLPVAIAVIASNLKGQQHRGHEWDTTLKSLKKRVSMHGVADDLVGIYKCLKFSYDYMKDEQAKGLFLLCSIFREDEIIPIEILTRLGIGAGLFGDDYGSYNDARNQVVVAKNKLLDSCLLLEVSEGRVKMHDLVRKAAQWIANEEIRAVNLSDKDQKPMVERENHIKYLLCEGKVMDVFSSRFGGSKLEILIVFNMDKDHHCVEVPNSLFENITGLRALHWSCRYHLALSLPRSIQSLKDIRSLLVDKVDLGDISILGNLQSLETLDLVRCKINELPHEITKLEKLKLLKLERCEVRRNNPFEVIKRCSSLEELYFKDSFNSFCQEITFPKLQRYHVYRYLEWAIMNESLSKCVAFDGDGDVGFLSEAIFKDCMQTVEILRLDGIKGEWRNLIPDIVPIDQGMNDLVELGLRGISQLQHLIDAIDSPVRNVLSKLVVLELGDMENLEELCNGPLSFDSLKSLKKIKIADCQHLRSLFKCNLNLCNLKTMRLWECPMLVSLFQLSTSQSLVQLEELRITDCERLENIIIDERKEEEEESREEIVDGGNDNKSHGSMFPKLKVLNIYKCPLLEYLFRFPSARDLPVLETIMIEKCDKLKCIFGQYVQLGSLEEMHLHDLPNFIDIFPEGDHLKSSSVKWPSSTSRDGSKAQTQANAITSSTICCYGKKYRHKLRSTTSTKLPFVSKNEPNDCSITSASDHLYHLHIRKCVQCLPIQSQILCNIKKIYLSHFWKIKAVFILSIAPKMSLETLTIKNCDELKHITIDTEDDSGDNNRSNVFPKLKELKVEDCVQLEYIFGHYDPDQIHNEIHLHLPALKCLSLCNLPSLIAMCPKKYRITFPPLTKLELIECSQVAIKSIGDFIVHSRSLDSTTIKEFSGNMEHFLALEWLRVYNSKVENIFFVNEINGQPMNLGLQNIELHDLPVMTYLFMGPKNAFALQNLIKIKIVRCEALEIMFSTSIVRCLPRLLNLIIEECKKLKHIIEDDVENKNMSNSLSQGTCFPKLQALVVINCNKLKCVLPASLCKWLPELKVVMIKEAEELEEIFGSKVDIPNLKMVAFIKLPSLCQAQGIQFQAVENRFVQSCPKLSLTSAPTQTNIYQIFGYDMDYDLQRDLRSLFEQLREEYKTQDPSNENQSEETTKDFAAGIEVQTSSEHELTSSQIKAKQTPEAGHEFVENVAGLEIPSIAISPKNSEDLLNEQLTSQQCLMNQQHPLGEIDTTVKHSQENNCLKETKDQSIQEGSTSEKTVPAILSTNSETRNKQPIQLVVPKQKGIERSVEEETKLANAKTITSATHLESVSSSPGPSIISERKTSSHCLKETEDQSIQEGSTSEKAPNNHKGVKRSDEEGNTLANSKTIISSTHSESVTSSSDPLVIPEHKTSSQEEDDGQIAIPSFSIATTKPLTTEEFDVRDSQETTETNDLVSLNDDASMKVISINVEEQFPKDDEIRVSESKSSPTIPSNVASLSPSMPSEGKPSQIVEDLTSIVMRELEQLVFKKHLAYETLPLLTDFLVKHPSVRLTNNSLTTKYKGYAYNCLAELLKFLQTHSVLDVLGSSHSEFVELLQDARICAFDKKWLDGVERRALRPGLQVSQDALQKLLDSKQQATKGVEMLRSKIDILTQHVEDLKHQLASSEAVLESIIQQEARVLEERAALCAPLGY